MNARLYLVKGMVVMLILLLKFNQAKAQNDYTSDAAARDSQNNEVYVLNNDYSTNKGSGIRFNSRSGDSKRAFIIHNTHNELTFRHSPTSSVTNAGDQLLTLTRLGDLGIGTTNPWHKLHVKGNLLVQSQDNGSEGILFTNYIKGLDDIHLNHDRAGDVIVGEASNSLNTNLVVWDNVGIGTNSPSQKLDVTGNIHIGGSNNLYTRHIKGLQYNGSGTNILYLQYDEVGDVVVGKSGVNSNLLVSNKIGIGTAPAERIHMSYGNIRIDNSGKAKIRHIEGIAHTGGAAEGLYLNWYTGKKVVVGSDVANKRSDLYVHGKIGIGNEAPTADLDVDGDIKADKVTLNIGSFPDYVFKPDYDLLTLSEVEDFIKDHGRLPKMPSESEVKDAGMDVGQINVLLVEKVEELTLYTIDQQKKLDDLTAEMNALKELIEEVSSRQ